MRNNYIIVSACDEKYFPLLSDLLVSIADSHRGQMPNIGIIDIGMTQSQSELLAKGNIRLKTAAWDLPLGDYPTPPGWFKAMTARPFLPRYFPDYDYIVWLDADTWVLDRSAITDMIATIEASDSIAITTESYAAAPVYFKFRLAEMKTVDGFVSEKNIRQNILDSYRLLDQDIPDDAAQWEIFNSGVFALSVRSPLWRIWADALATGLRRGWGILLEQQALNLVLHRNRARSPVHGLAPRTLNWNFGAELPLFDQMRAKLVSQQGEDIKILHLQEAKRAQFLEIPRKNQEPPLRLAPSYRVFRKYIGQPSPC